MTDIPLDSYSGTAHVERVADEGRLDAILAALEDSDCRTIMAATAETALSASEIADQCDIALSTTYRKIEQLSDAQLLDERVRLDSTTKYTHEYTLAVDDIEIRVSAGDGVEAILVRTTGEVDADGESLESATAD